MNNKLYELFDVESEEELIEFIKNNPEDPRVIELKELINLLEE